MNMHDEAPKIMWRVFEWAYDNDIEISLRPKYEGYGEGFPILRFRKNDKNIEQAFYTATDLSGRIEFIWRKIALELCVKPLDLSNLANVEPASATAVSSNIKCPTCGSFNTIVQNKDYPRCIDCLDCGEYFRVKPASAEDKGET